MAGNSMRFLREKLTRLPTGKGILTHRSSRSQLFFSYLFIFSPFFTDFAKFYRFMRVDADICNPLTGLYVLCPLHSAKAFFKSIPQKHSLKRLYIPCSV